MSTTNCVVCVAPPASATWSLVKVQVAANGRPRQPRSRVSLKLLSEARVSVAVMCCWVCKVSVAGLICMVNWVGFATVMVVTGEVEGNPDEPGGDGTVGAEAGAGGPGAEEGLLGEGLGGVAVAQRDQQEAEDARAVEGDDGCEVVERGGARVGGDGETGRREGLDVFRHH